MNKFRTSEQDKNEVITIIVKCSNKNRKQLNDFLSKDSLYNTFIRSDLDIYGFNTVFQTLYMSVDDRDQCQFVYLIFHNIMIVAGDIKELKLENLTSLLEDKIDIIMGKEALISKCYTRLRQNFDYSEKLFYALMDPSCLLTNELFASQASADDSAAIHSFLNTFDEFKGMYASADMILNRIIGQEGQHLYYKDKGQIIAHGNTAATTRDSCMIGGVATHIDYRHQTYAKRILSQLSRQAIKSHRTPCLLSPPYQGKAFFEDLGYQLYGSWGTLKRK